nr:hypothetical protein [Tanacetum cinerariifolium]GEZ03346.1 hypothetical protein [Tanacetum cinerariifolium]
MPDGSYLAPNSPVQVNKIASSCEICNGSHNTQYCMENPEQAFVDYASSYNDKVGGKLFTTNQGPRNFNKSTHAWKDKPNFNWTRTQTFASPKGGSLSTYTSNIQSKLKRVLSDFDSHQEKRLSSLRTQLKQQQDEENKIGTHLLPKRVHFINTITIISKECEPKEVWIVEANETKDNEHDTLAKVKEKVGGEFKDFETIINETKSRDLKQNNIGDRAYRCTKEVEESEE